MPVWSDSLKVCIGMSGWLLSERRDDIWIIFDVLECVGLSYCPVALLTGPHLISLGCAPPLGSLLRQVVPRSSSTGWCTDNPFYTRLCPNHGRWRRLPGRQLLGEQVTSTCDANLLKTRWEPTVRERRMECIGMWIGYETSTGPWILEWTLDIKSEGIGMLDCVGLCWHKFKRPELQHSPP